MCGEYGEQTRRPHYHACLFGVHFRSDMVLHAKSASGSFMYSSPSLERIWSHGFCTVQELVPETASYCARYIMKKALGQNALSAYQTVTEDGEIIQLVPEYARMSLKPGVGARWYERYSKSISP